VSEPILVIDAGRGTPGFGRVSLATGGWVFAIALLLGLLNVSGGDFRLVGTVALIFTAALVSAVFFRRNLAGRWGRVEFRALTITFKKGGAKAMVGWADLAGFRDDDATFIELVSRKGIFPRAWLTVPTPLESQRVAVLELLVARGIPRIEPSSQEP
jgi:hypothetical protein